MVSDKQSGEISCDNPQTAQSECTFKRLPAEIVPLRYELEYEPSFDPEKPIFQCKQLIRIKVKAPTTVITLNSVGLTFTRTYFKHERTEDTMDAAEVIEDKELERVRIIFDETLEIGVIKLFIEFRGTYSDVAGFGRKGIYRSPFKDKDGIQKYNYLTNFGPTYARYAFACFDEPELKANFTISLIVPPGHTALSNMPIKSESPIPRIPDHALVTFERTPLMSTYLTAWAIGDFEYFEETTEGRPIRIYVPHNKKELGQHALNVATKAMEFYKNFFGLAYPLPKLDMVVVGHLLGTATANWGLISFRESEILIDPRETSLLNKQRVTLLVARELAHQWFGNLVTLQWWTDLWLTKGFVNFVSYICVDKIYTEFSIWNHFQQEVRIPALEQDALGTMPPISDTVNNPSEIVDKFGNFSILKASALLRMLYDYVGEKAFRDGLQQYFKTYQFNNARAEHLWQNLRKSNGGKKISTIMSTWTKQEGYPLITVYKSTETDDSGYGLERILELHMEPFWTDERLYRNRERVHNLKWIVPITICKASEPGTVIRNELFDGTKSNEMLTTISPVGPQNTLKLNVGNFGYYRVHYATEIWTRLRPSVFFPMDRLGYLDDLFGVAKCGKSAKLIESHLTCDVLKQIKDLSEVNNQDYVVWMGIDNILNQMNQLLLECEYLDRFHAFGRYVLNKIQVKLGWTPKPTEDHLTRLLRQVVINRLIEFGDRKVFKTAKRLFDAFLSGERAIPPDFRFVIYKAVLSDSDLTVDNLEIFLKMYREAELPDEKVRILRSLGNVQNVETLERVLEFSVSDEVSLENCSEILIQATRSKNGREMTWELFKKNWELFAQRFQDEPESMHRLMVAVSGNFTSKEKLKEVQSFFNQIMTLPGVDQTSKNILQNIRTNEGWLAKDGSKGVQKFLATFIRYIMPNDIPKFKGLLLELMSQKYNPYIPPANVDKTITAK